MTMIGCYDLEAHEEGAVVTEIERRCKLAKLVPNNCLIICNSKWGEWGFDLEHGVDEEFFEAVTKVGLRISEISLNYSHGIDICFKLPKTVENLVKRAARMQLKEDVEREERH